MKKIIATSVLILCFQFVAIFAQTGTKADKVKVQKKLEPYDPITALEKAGTAFEKGSYRESLKYYEKIHPNDTSYVDALLQRVVCHLNMEDGDNEKAIELCEEGITIDQEYLNLFYLNKGVALNKMDKSKEAIAHFDKAIERFPYYPEFYIYKGYNYSDLEQHDKALVAFQDAIERFPFNSEAHTALAVLAMEAGALTQAVLSLTTSLFIEPDSPKSLSVLSGVNDLVSEKQDVEISGLKINNAEESFEDTDLLIQNYIALDAKYKTPSKLTFPFIKQLYLVLTESDKNQKGFWSNTYLPFYKKILDNKVFEDFSYLISYSSENERHQALFEKKLKDIKNVNGMCIEWWSEQHAWRKAPAGMDLDKARYWYSNGGVELIGGYNKSTQQLQGPVKFFDEQGYLSREGKVSKTGKSTGLWKYYYQNGKLRRTSEFKDGMLSGETVLYLQNGNTELRRFFKADEPHGISEYYKQVGYKYEEMNYVNGKAQGTMKGFGSNGDLKYEFDYKDNQRNGKYTAYYPDGKVSAKGQFKNDKIDGVFERFHHNGEKSVVTNYDEGEYQGKHESYYSNGQLQTSGSYVESTQVGEWLSYNINGKLIEKENFDEKGKLTGSSIQYDENGNKTIEFEYKNGKLISYKCYDESGGILKEDESKKGLASLISVHPWGAKQTEGAYKSGERDGMWKFHDEYGNLDEEQNYKNGKRQGLGRSFFADGSIRSEHNSENGERDGLYTQYYPNGAVEYYVYYVDNDFEGRFLNYSPKGDFISDQYYSKGNEHGWNRYYNRNGELWLKIKYEQGFPVEILRFGPNEEQWGHSKIVNGDGVDSFKFPNGVEGRNRIYKGGDLEGTSTSFYPNKQISSQGDYVSGEQHGPWKWYWPNGQVRDECTYVYDDLEGNYKEYYEDGVLETESNYRDGKLDGEYKSYHDNGTLAFEMTYQYGEIHGERKSYSPTGDLELVRYYDNGRFYAYAYLDSKGELKDPIPIKNGSGTIKTSYQNGEIAHDSNYKNGLLDGPYVINYSNGQKRINAIYTNGHRNGKCQWFHENGQLDFEAEYYYGDKMGVGTYYHPNGKVKSTGSYYLNEKEGEFKYFDENGKLIETRMYFGGMIYEIR